MLLAKRIGVLDKRLDEVEVASAASLSLPPRTPTRRRLLEGQIAEARDDNGGPEHWLQALELGHCRVADSVRKANGHRICGARVELPLRCPLGCRLRSVVGPACGNVSRIRHRLQVRSWAALADLVVDTEVGKHVVGWLVQSLGKSNKGKFAGLVLGVCFPERFRKVATFVESIVRAGLSKSFTEMSQTVYQMQAYAYRANSASMAVPLYGFSQVRISPLSPALAFPTRAMASETPPSRSLCGNSMALLGPRGRNPKIVSPSVRTILDVLGWS